MLELLWATDTICTKINADDLRFEDIFTQKEITLERLFTGILFVLFLCDGFL